MRVFFSKPGAHQIVRISSLTAKGRTIHAGDEVVVRGFIENPEAYPLYNLQLFGVVAKVEQKKKEWKLYGDSLFEDFLIFPYLNLGPHELRSFSFKMEIPCNALSGLHSIHLSLNQDRRFPISGMSYYYSASSWYNRASSVFFDVDEGSPDIVRIDKGSFKIASEGGFSEAFYHGEHSIRGTNLEISFTVINDSKVKEEVVLTYDLMNVRRDLFAKFIDPGWDDTILKEKVTLKGNERKIIRRKIILPQTGKLSSEVSGYFSVLVVSLLSSRARSAFYIKLLLQNEHMPRAVFKWPGIDQFPIRKGSRLTIFCGFTSHDSAASGNQNISLPANRQSVVMRLQLLDRRGTVIGGASYQGIADDKIRGWKNVIRIGKDYDYVKMIGEINDLSGTLEDRFEREYSLPTDSA